MTCFESGLKHKAGALCGILTHWCWDKIAAIFQTTLWNRFSWMKMYQFWLISHWSFPRVQLTIFQHWFRLWLGTGQATSHYLNQWWLLYWCIYASLGLNYRNWPRYGLRWSGWYCNPEQHELCRPSRGLLRPRRPAQRVLFRIAVPTTTAQTV